MSYEKKIQELMARLVSMTPEPPPYPEETQMARHEATKRHHPALVFAAAVAAVALLAIPVILFTGNETPVGVATTTTTTVPAPSTTAGVSTTTQSETDTTQVVLPVWSRPGVFLYQAPENSFGGNPALVPVILEVTPLDPDAEFTQALAALGTNLPDGLANAIPADVSILSTQIDGDVIVADLNEAFLDGAGGLLADMTMLNQLIYTLTYSDPEATVRFTVNGQPVEAFGTEGLILTEPVGRDDFLDHVHVINLTSSIVEIEDGWIVVGIANVFEATVSIAVLDGSGDVVHEEFVTATCGTGCWGEFSGVIDAEHVVPGVSSILLFTHSAEDGSITDAITVPIPERGVWTFTIG